MDAGRERPGMAKSVPAEEKRETKKSEPYQNTWNLKQKPKTDA